MLEFFRYNKIKREVIKFFNAYEVVDYVNEKPKGILEIKFTSITKNDLLLISSKLLNALRTDIADIEVVFNENTELSIANSILIGLKNRLPSRLNLHQTGECYENLIEYRTSQKYGKTTESELGGLIFSSNIGTYYIFKLK